MRHAVFEDKTEVEYQFCGIAAIYLIQALNECGLFAATLRSWNTALTDITLRSLLCFPGLYWLLPIVRHLTVDIKELESFLKAAEVTEYALESRSALYLSFLLKQFNAHHY